MRNRKNYVIEQPDETFEVKGFRDSTDGAQEDGAGSLDYKAEFAKQQGALDDMTQKAEEFRIFGRNTFIALIAVSIFLAVAVIAFSITSVYFVKDIDYWKSQAQIEEVEIWNDLCADSDERRIVAEACKDASYSGIILDESACRLTLIWMETKSGEQYYLYVMHHADKKYSVSVKQYADGHYYVDFIGEVRE